MDSTASVSVCNHYSSLSVSSAMTSNARCQNSSVHCSSCTFRDLSPSYKAVPSSVLSRLNTSPLNPYSPYYAYCSTITICASVCSCSSQLTTVCSPLTLFSSLVPGATSLKNGQTIWTSFDFRLLLWSSCPAYPSMSESMNCNYCHPATTLYFLNTLTRTCSISMSWLSINCLSYTPVTLFPLSGQPSSH